VLSAASDGQGSVLSMTETLVFGSLAGRGGWRNDFPLTAGRKEYQLDMRGLGACHPMFLIRLRTFLEWQQREGSPVDVLLPTDATVRTHIVGMSVFENVEVTKDETPTVLPGKAGRILPVTTVADAAGIERLADAAVTALGSAPTAARRLASPLHMAISELGDNAVSHGRNDLGVRVACSIDHTGREVRLAVGDLGRSSPCSQAGSRPGCL
jgi:hypothetical protein